MKQIDTSKPTLAKLLDEGYCPIPICSNDGVVQHYISFEKRKGVIYDHQRDNIVQEYRIEPPERKPIIQRDE